MTAELRAHHQAQEEAKATFGFWIYLMTDCLLFASIFATYGVLRNNTFGGPAGRDLFNLPFVLVETFILLSSSFTCGLAMLGAHRGNKNQTLAWFGATFVLGASFLGMELYEFRHLIQDGHGPQHSGFLSAFFTLVGTHGLHITAGLLALAILMVYIFRRGVTPGNLRGLTAFSLFWHFLDIIWIFIFTLVYLLGVAQ